MEKYLNLLNNNFLKILVTFIVLDVIFGVFRALIEKELNSTIGIDGIIRKIAMIVAIVVCLFLDYLINIDLIFFVPMELKDVIHISKIGISGLFSLLYILFEALSILKNMHKCKLPMPKPLKKWIEKLLKELTSEVKEENIK